MLYCEVFVSEFELKLYYYVYSLIPLGKVCNLLSSFFCSDVAEGHMNWAPNETQTYSCMFASLAC